MENQATAFGLVLDREMQLRVTLSDAAIQQVIVLLTCNSWLPSLPIHFFDKKSLLFSFQLLLPILFRLMFVSNFASSTRKLQTKMLLFIFSQYTK